MDKRRKWGKRLIVTGMLMLALGLVLAFLVNWNLIPLLISGSIFVNTAGVLLLRGGKRGEDRR